MTLLDHRNTAATKKLDFKNSHLASVGATGSQRILAEEQLEDRRSLPRAIKCIKINDFGFRDGALRDPGASLY